jgi:hypothetical protein
VRRDKPDVRRGDFGELVVLEVHIKNREDRKEVFRAGGCIADMTMW